MRPQGGALHKRVGGRVVSTGGCCAVLVVQMEAARWEGVDAEGVVVWKRTRVSRREGCLTDPTDKETSLQEQFEFKFD